MHYGNGLSETHLGQVLAKLKPSGIFVGTKVRIPSAQFGGIAAEPGERDQRRGIGQRCGVIDANKAVGDRNSSLKQRHTKRP